MFNQFDRDKQLKLIEEDKKLSRNEVIKLCRDFVSAAEKGDQELFNQLLERPIVQHNVAGRNNAALNKAIENGQTEIAKKLLTFKAVTDKIKSSSTKTKCDCFELAINSEHLDILDPLMSLESVKTSLENSNEALHLAISTGNVGLVNKLLENETVLKNITKDKNAALNIAVKCGNPDVISAIGKVDSVREYEVKHNGPNKEALEQNFNRSRTKSARK